jgi:hypothetical protein
MEFVGEITFALEKIQAVLNFITIVMNKLDEDSW